MSFENFKNQYLLLENEFSEDNIVDSILSCYDLSKNLLENGDEELGKKYYYIGELLTKIYYETYESKNYTIIKII